MTRSIKHRQKKNVKTERSVYDVLVYPDLSEKNTRLAEDRNTYVFVVDSEATKPEIKRAVEEIFSVRVKSVNTLVRRGKSKVSNLGHASRKKDTKRAFVTVNAEDKIDLL